MKWIIAIIVIGVGIYLLIPSRKELLRIITDPNSTQSDRASATQTLATMYPPTEDQKKWAEAERAKQITTPFPARTPAPTTPKPGAWMFDKR